MTPSELVLLGLVAEQPRHGYELEEVIAARGMREWTEIGFSSIYYVLGKLRERGLVTETTEPSVRGKPRKVYAPTPAGLRELAQAAEAAIADLRSVQPALLVGLANEPSIPRHRLIAALEARRRALGERIAAVRAAAAKQPDVPGFVTAIFDYSVGQLEAEKRWLEQYLGARQRLGTIPSSEQQPDALCQDPADKIHPSASKLVLAASRSTNLTRRLGGLAHGHPSS